MRQRLEVGSAMFTVVVFLILSGIAGAVVVWSMSWEGAWPGPAAADGGREPAPARTVEAVPAEVPAAYGAGSTVSAPWEGDGEPGTRGRRGRGRTAREAVATQSGVPAAVAMMEHGEAYAPPSVLGRLWAMLRLVLVVALTCGVIAGAIYLVASTLSKAVGHGG
jgi:hypothetical protein